MSDQVERGESRVVSVTPTLAGDFVPVDVAAGATLLPVDDVLVFGEDPTGDTDPGPQGGWVRLDAEDGSTTVLEFTSVVEDDPDAEDGVGSLVLAVPLAAAVVADTPVVLFDGDPVEGGLPVVLYEVDLVDDDQVGGDPDAAVLAPGLVDVLPAGIRDPGQGEWVTWERSDPNGAATVTGLVGREITRDGRFINPATLPAVTSDGFVPDFSPTPSVVAGIRSLHLSWVAIENADAVTYRVDLGTTDDFVVADETKVGITGGTTLTVPELDTTQTYWVRLTAEDADGSAEPSEAVEGTPRQATGADIAAEFAYVGTLLANQIRGGELSADVILAAMLKTAETGARTELGPDGLRVYGATGVLGTIVGALQSVFRGDSEFGQNTVTGMAVRSLLEMSRGSSLVLESGVTASALPPAAETTFHEVTLTTPFTFGTLVTTSLNWNGTGWTVGGYRTDGTTSYLYTFNYSAAGAYLNSEFGGWSYSSAFARTMLGACYGGGDHFGIYSSVAGYTFIGENKDNDNAHKTILPAENDTVAPGIAPDPDGLHVHILERHPTNGSIVVRKIRLYTETENPDGPAAVVVSRVEYGTGWTTSDTPVGFVAAGSGDYGVSRATLAVNQAGKLARIYPYNGTTADLDRRWLGTTADVTGLAWDGAHFWSLTGMSLHRYEGGNHAYLGDPDRDWWAGFTWRNIAGGYESTISNLRSFRMRKRRRVNVVTSQPNDTGSAEDPDAVRVYLSNSATEPARTGLWLNGSPAAGVTSVNVTAATFTGTNPPLASSFPDAAPSQWHTRRLNAATGLPVAYALGSGPGAVGPYGWDADGKSTLRSAVLTPTMADVLLHAVKVWEIAPGTVAITVSMDVDVNKARTNTGMVLPTWARPSVEVITASPYAGTGVSAYRYFFLPSGQIDYEGPGGGPHETIQALWQVPQ